MIELLVVIAIIGILSAMLITVVNPSLQLEKSRDSRRKSDLKLMQSALELYRSDQGTYPSWSGVLGNCPSSSPTSLVDDPNGDCSVINTTYMQSVPKDPGTQADYYYLPSSSDYAIYSCLENTSDKDKLSGTSTPATPPSGPITYQLNCSSSTYYGVVNP